MPEAAPVLETTPAFADFLASEQSKGLLRFTTAGSVDDGKSTLIGRLLYDSRSVYEDQLESITKASIGRNAGAIDFSLLTDGLRAEREQGITIDVAYRYFATPRRKFIIADTPGHEQYTRNMVTGASTADLAIVLIDARKGLLPQSRRHAYISSLLGLPHLVVAVNKMDLVGYDQQVFAQIEADFRRFLLPFQSIEPYFVPISALAGDNVVTRSRNTLWFTGPSLLEYLEQVPVGSTADRSPFRFPVQRVVRPDLDFRGYAGTLAAGTIRPGDAVTVLPSGRTSRIARIVTFDGDLPVAQAGDSVTLTLEDEVDISRGDLFAGSGHPPHTATMIEATVVWVNEVPAEVGKRYRLKHATSLQSADLQSIEYRTNINTLDREHVQSLEMNAIGVVRLATARPIAFDPYKVNRVTGSFILIDPATNATVAAGLINGRVSDSPSQPAAKAPKPVTAEERYARQGHSGARIEFAAASAELAWRLERLLYDRGASVYRFSEPDLSLTEALVALGVIVITVAPEGSLPSVTAAGSSTPIPDLSLTAIESLLQTLGIFHQASWADSGGI